MKLRIQGKTVRLRVDRRDLEELIERGRVEHSLVFGPDPEQAFSYELALEEGGPAVPRVAYRKGRFTVTLDASQARTWHESERVGFESEELSEEGNVIRLILEKDFVCVDRVSRETGEESAGFPNPKDRC